MFDGGSEDLDKQIDIFDKQVIGATVDYVTLTIGGNDLGFGDIVTAAAVNGLNRAPDVWGKAIRDRDYLRVGGVGLVMEEALAKFEKETKKKLSEVYDAIRQKAPNATIIVAGYPHLAPKDGGGIFNEVEAESINKGIDTFNSEIGKLIVAKDNFEFVDVRPAFNGHEAYTDDSYIKGVIFGPQDQDLNQVFGDEAKNWVSAYSMHPNEKGQAAYAEAVQAVINRLGPVAANDAEVDSTVAMSLVFDVSGSMNENSAIGGMSKLASAKKQSTDFVSSIGGQKATGAGLSVRVGVCSFASSARTNCGLSTDPDEINASINALKADGQTNMYAGLANGIEQLMGEDGPRLMVFLSDGLSNVGGSTSEILALADKASSAGIKIYTIGFGASSSLDEGLLREIAERTGGEYSYEDSSNISSAAVGLFAAMMNARLQTTYRILHSIIGAVSQGVVEPAGSFDITKNGTVQVYLYWPGSVLDLQLTDPSGTQVAEGYPGYTVDTSSIPTSITIQNAKQGTWNMAVFGHEVSMPEEPYYAVAAFDETEAPAGGGGASSSGDGLIFMVLVVGIACVVGVFAYTKRRSST